MSKLQKKNVLKIVVSVAVIVLCIIYFVTYTHKVQPSLQQQVENNEQSTAPVNPNHVKINLAGKIFGTTYHLSYFKDEIPNLTPEQVKDRIDKYLNAYNQIVSTFIPTSTISRFNQFHEVDKPFPVPKEFAHIFIEAEKVYKLSSGYYDCTVYPLVKAWGFGPGKPIPHFTQAEVDTMKQHVGMDKIVLSEVNGQYYLTKKDPYVTLDFSSIAKGRGVDLTGDLLASLGAKNYVVEIGGEVVAHGLNEVNKPWNIAIEQPTYDGSEIVNTIIAVKNQAIATSGDYRNFRFVDGHRITHEINPFTGYPITHNTASLTVIDDNCMDADAWSTALYVMGSEKAIALANKLHLAIFCIDYVNGKYITKQSEWFNKDVKIIATE